MKKKSNEWVSIADLMSGVMAVVMLLLVISVLQNTYAEMKHKQQLEGSRDSQQKNMIKTLNDIKQEVSLQGGTDLIDFNIEQGTITLKDSIFAQGSACITPKAAHAFTNIKGKIETFLKSSNQAGIFVEGHTDNIPVSKIGRAHV